MIDRLSTAFQAFVVSLTLSALMLAAPTALQAAEEIDISGEYFCRGSNPGGGSYSGKVAITKTDQTYKIQWKIGTGQGHVGIGIREDNVLSVCFVGSGGAEGIAMVGVVSYKIQKDKDGPRLVGRWAAFGGQKTQTETLSRSAPPPEKGTQRPQQVTSLSRPTLAETI